MLELSPEPSVAMTTKLGQIIQILLLYIIKEIEKSIDVGILKEYRYFRQLTLFTVQSNWNVWFEACDSNMEIKCSNLEKRF